MKRIVALMAVVLSTVNVFAFILAWDLPSADNIAGYRFYYGVASRTYTNVTDVGYRFTNRVNGLVSGTKYFFAITAYYTNRVESDFSPELVYTVQSNKLGNYVLVSVAVEGATAVTGPWNDVSLAWSNLPPIMFTNQSGASYYRARLSVTLTNAP